MGAWGTDSFANDDAMDWVAELEAAGDTAVVRAALIAAAGDDSERGEGSEYIEAPTGSVALAAAEVVAALRGRPHPELPEAVTTWVAASGRDPDPALARIAVRAVDAVADDPEKPELRGLWDEAVPEDREM